MTNDELGTAKPARSLVIGHFHRCSRQCARGAGQPAEGEREDRVDHRVEQEVAGVDQQRGGRGPRPPAAGGTPPPPPPAQGAPARPPPKKTPTGQPVLNKHNGRELPPRS